MKTIQRLGILLSALALAGAVGACAGKEPSLPSLSLRSGEQVWELSPARASWFDGRTGIEMDAAHPLDPNAVHTQVPCGEFTLCFDREPDKVTVRRYCFDAQGREQGIFDGESRRFSVEAGAAAEGRAGLTAAGIYEIEGEWKEGTVGWTVQASPS